MSWNLIHGVLIWLGAKKHDNYAFDLGALNTHEPSRVQDGTVEDGLITATCCNSPV